MLRRSCAAGGGGSQSGGGEGGGGSGGRGGGGDASGGGGSTGGSSPWRLLTVLFAALIAGMPVPTRCLRRESVTLQAADFQQIQETRGITAHLIFYLLLLWLASACIKKREP